MGYRSQVRSVIYGNPEIVNTLLVKTKLMDNTVFKEFKDNIRVDVLEKIKFIELVGEEWKWYDDFKEVKAWQQLLNDANELGLATEFVRVGEESGDIETIQNDGDGDEGHECEYVLSTYTTICSYFGD